MVSALEKNYTSQLTSIDIISITHIYNLHYCYDYYYVATATIETPNIVRIVDATNTTLKIL